MKTKPNTGSRPALKSLKYLVAIPLAAFFMALTPSKITSGKPDIEKRIQTIPADNTASLEQIEKQAFDLVNKHRKSIGLPALINKDYIVAQARQHSADMASGKVGFGHDGAEERLKIISKSLKEMSNGGENVFTCTGNYDNLAGTAVEGWLKSKGHRENIEGDYNLSGIGVEKAANDDYYFTQIFAKGKE